MNDATLELLPLLARIAASLEAIQQNQQDIAGSLDSLDSSLHTLSGSLHAIAVTYEDSKAIR